MNQFEGGGSRPSLRLAPLLICGVIDSTGLAFGWTIALLVITDRGGLAAGAVLSASMLVGIALSAPVSAELSGRLSPHDLLRRLAVAEGAARLGLFVLLWGHADVRALSLLVIVMNALAWSAFAAMRAEVARVEEEAGSGRSLTWYAVAIAASEALAAGAAAVLVDRTPSAVTVAVTTAGYVLSLVPQWWVGSRADQLPPPAWVSPARSGPSVGPLGSAWARRPGRLRHRWARAVRWWPSAAVLAPAGLGAVVFLLAGAPALLATVLAYQFYGARGVVVSAVAFTVGSLGASRVQAALTDRRPPALPLLLLGVLLIGGWSVAGQGLVGLAVAQGCAGLAQCALEGELDSRIVSRLPPGEVTAGLAFASSSRAIGGAIAVTVLPELLAYSSLPTLIGVAVTVLLLVVGALLVIEAVHPVRHLPRSFAVGFAAGRVTGAVTGAAMRVREVTGVGRPSMPAWQRR